MSMYETNAPAIMTTDPLELSSTIGTRLRELGWSCATAESITGGLIGHFITSISGASDYFLGGIVAYSNPIKQSLLNVTPETLTQSGAVSAPCASEMAQGARSRLEADVGLASTGIAGPGGATSRKPVGLVYICVVTPEDNQVRELRLSGDRAANIHDTAIRVLQLTSSLLNEEPAT